MNQWKESDVASVFFSAMQKKPVGESRIPTDYWAGLGFSRSMPASEIRDRLNPNDSSYDGPKMTTPYEVSAPSELDVLRGWWQLILGL